MGKRFKEFADLPALDKKKLLGKWLDGKVLELFLDVESSEEETEVMVGHQKGG